MPENARDPARFVSARIDTAFRSLMRNPRVCRDFLCAALGWAEDGICAVDDVPIASLGACEAYRKGMFRYRLSLREGRAMEALVVVTRQPCWEARSMMYAGRMCVEQQGDAGALGLTPIAIIGVREAEGDDARCYSSYRMREDVSGEAYSSLVQVHQIDLPARAPDPTASHRMAWVSFLSANTREEQGAAANACPAIREALLELDAIAEDASAYAEYRSRVAAIEEFAEELRLAHREGFRRGERHARGAAEDAGRQEGRREGRLQGYKDGLKEGRTESQRDIARLMLENGADWRLIQSVTRLSHAQVDEIWQGIQGA